MKIFNLKHPSHLIQFGDEDRQKNYELNNLISMIEGDLIEASLAVNFFDEEYLSGKHTTLQYNLEMKKVSHASDGEEKMKAYEEMSVDPQSFIHSKRVLFMYAKIFLYNLDSIYKNLNVIENIDGLPQGVYNTINEFRSHFSTLHEVRNSLQHMEDRVRLKGPRNSPINPKLLQTNDLSILSGTTFISSHLSDNKFIALLANGEYGEIEISTKTLTEASTMLQYLINELKWR